MCAIIIYSVFYNLKIASKHEERWFFWGLPTCCPHGAVKRAPAGTLLLIWNLKDGCWGFYAHLLSKRKSLWLPLHPSKALYGMNYKNHTANPGQGCRDSGPRERHPWLHGPLLSLQTRVCWEDLPTNSYIKLLSTCQGPSAETQYMQRRKKSPTCPSGSQPSGEIEGSVAITAVWNMHDAFWGQEERLFRLALRAGDGWDNFLKPRGGVISGEATV